MAERRLSTDCRNGPLRGALCLLAAFAFITTARAAELACDGTPVTVEAAEPALAERTCRATRRILPRLAECGIRLTTPQHVTVTDRIEDAPGCLGLYHCGENRIELLAPGAIEALRQSDGFFHAVPTTDYYESILAHELVHAAYDAVPCPLDTCIVTGEYLAYAMQVRSLSEANRRAAERDLDMETPVHRDQLNLMTLLMATDRFARFAWIHFSQRPDACGYARQMMSGTFRLDIERP